MTGGAAASYSFGLGYAPDGDVTAATDSAHGDWSYGYDALNRLISAAGNGVTIGYGYDRFGNMWQHTISPAPHPAPPAPARFQSGYTGRFMTPDPFDPLALKPRARYAWMFNPQRWDKYVYALDNPVTLVDPNGMNACGDKDDSKCKVTITFQARTRDAKGNYSDQFTGVKDQNQYNATATVKVNGKVVGTVLARTIPSGARSATSNYPTIANGTYTATLGKHNGQPALLINAGGKVPVVGDLDRATRSHTAIGILVHPGALAIMPVCTTTIRRAYPRAAS